MRYIANGKPWSEEEIQSFVTRQRQNELRHGFCLGPMLDRTTAEGIGMAGLQHLGSTGDVEIGWWVAKHRWGRGLATEAGRALVRFAFEGVGLPRVVAIAAPQNRASIRVMQKLGMSFLRRASGHELGLRNPDVEVVVYLLEQSGFQGRDHED
jgi:RimJ/RimL family protein N-acetyltransferase